MSAPDFRTILRHFMPHPRFKPDGGAWGKVRGSLQSSGFTFRAAWMIAPNFMAVTSRSCWVISVWTKVMERLDRCCHTYNRIAIAGEEVEENSGTEDPRTRLYLFNCLGERDLSLVQNAIPMKCRCSLLQQLTVEKKVQWSHVFSVCLQCFY